jgi:hypothetical protein
MEGGSADEVHGRAVWSARSSLAILALPVQGGGPTTLRRSAGRRMCAAYSRIALFVRVECSIAAAEGPSRSRSPAVMRTILC